MRHQHLANVLRAFQTINLQPAATLTPLAILLQLEAMAVFSEIMSMLCEVAANALTLQTPLVETKLNASSMRGCLQGRPTSRPVDVPATDIFVV